MAFDVYVDDAACIATLEALAVTAPEACATGVNAALEEGKGMAEEDIKVDTGAAKSLIDIIPAGPIAIFDAQLRSMAQYSTAIEFDIKPHFPPPKALLGWASRHNSSGYTDEQFAYLVARGIAKHGTSGKPYIAYLAEEKLPALILTQVEIALAEWTAI